MITRKLSELDFTNASHVCIGYAMANRSSALGNAHISIFVPAIDGEEDEPVVIDGVTFRVFKATDADGDVACFLRNDELNLNGGVLDVHLGNHIPFVEATLEELRDTLTSVIDK